MGRIRQAPSSSRSKRDEIEELPAYEDAVGSSRQAQQSATRIQSADIKGQAPSYARSPESVQKPIVVPQLSAKPDAPFLPAYAPSLLSYGIPEESWASLLATLSALLAATTGDQAISHAGDVAKRVGNVPKQYGKNVAAHAKSLGRNITDCAKQGNIVGAAVGTIGGGIGFTIATTFGAVGALLSLPGTSIGAAVRKPQTPRQRATVYLQAANKDWFQSRGLYAQLLDTQELASLLNVPSNQILEHSMAGKSADAETQLRLLRPYVSELTVDNAEGLKLGEKTLWLVITRAVEPEAIVAEYAHTAVVGWRSSSANFPPV